jgi:peptidoglycan/xylan/chitin deacetylase (PgdA/CDA1 family)
MRAISLMYHDVIPDATEQSNVPQRFTPYTLNLTQFREHLSSIRPGLPVQTIQDFRSWTDEIPIFLTFDDGNASALTLAAGVLEQYSWHGHFFVTTDWIGKSGFMNRAQIIELRKRGHVIGSHSCSHPERMSHLSTAELIREWSQSCSVLTGILGERVRTASVPAGYYSSRVGKAAAAAGIRVLFTSEPTGRVQTEQGCLIIGRYYIQNQMPSDLSGKIAAGFIRPRWSQTATWQAKKIVKVLMGESYFTFRAWVLAGLKRQRRSSAREFKGG